jgi:hypothetical protein
MEHLSPSPGLLHPIPSNWTRDPKVKTLTELQLRLKQQRLSHPSFDLDGDGVVGGQDLMLASRFDDDKDGRLNTSELAKARQALEGGYADQFLWGCERSGVKRPFRVVQVRGKIITDESFNSITDTYSHSPGISPRFKTKTELVSFRRKERTIQASAVQERQQLAQRIPNQFTPWEGYVEVPKYRTLSEAHNELRNSNRAKAGLTIQAKDTLQMPKYVDSPVSSTLTALKQRRRSELSSHSCKQSLETGYKTFSERLQAEQGRVVAGEETLAPTYKERLQERRMILTKDLELKFSNRPFGVHQKELPKFADHLQEWWKKDGPTLETSQRSLLQTRLHG